MSSMAPARRDARINPALWGALLVLPSTLFWACLTLSLIPRLSALADPWLALVQRYDLLFVVGVLMLLPLGGSLLGAAGWKRGRLLSLIVVVLGVGTLTLNLLMQAEQPGPAL